MQNIEFPEGMINDGIKKLFDILSKAKCEARFVGGCVRDAIVGKAVSDIDVAVDVRPDLVIKILQNNQIRYIPTGLKHGTITALVNGTTVEITSLRKDIDCDGRHAVVEFTSSWEEDALRRDFTINAMYADIHGRIYDFHSGYKDLMEKKIRFVGNAAKRIEEDTLRILRYYRFVSSHGTVENMDAEAVQACRIYSIQLASLSGERIQMEMRKIVNSKQASQILAIMSDHGVTKQISLDIDNPQLLQQLVKLEQDYDFIELDSLAKLASLVRKSTKSAREAALMLATDWKLSNRDGVLLLQYAAPNRNVTVETELKNQKVLLRKLPRQVYLNLLYLSWAESRLNQEDHDAAYKTMASFADQWQIPKFPVTGLDLLQIGIPKGRIVGRILKAAESWWEGQDYQPAKEEILQFIRKEASCDA